jgi:hypothetical protein
MNTKRRPIWQLAALAALASIFYVVFMFGVNQITKPPPTSTPMNGNDIARASMTAYIVTVNAAQTKRVTMIAMYNATFNAELHATPSTTPTPSATP